MYRFYPFSSFVVGTCVLASFATTAHANCNVNGNDVTCSGDVQGQNIQNQGNTLTVENLTSNINQALVFSNFGPNADSSSNGNPGGNGGSLTYSFSGGSHGLTWNGQQEPGLFSYGVLGNSQGGDAASGRHHNEPVGDANGDPGGTGGNGGTVTTTFNSGDVSLTQVFQPDLEAYLVGAQSVGGQGGAGGDAETTTGVATGGDGNSGGHGGNVSTTVSSGTLTFTSGTILAVGAYASSQGGEGGVGGEGKTHIGGDAHGGDGGTGGDGWAASVTVDNATIEIATIGGAAVQAASIGNVGGEGGEAKPAGGDAFAGNGGQGGNASAVTVDLSSSNTVLTTSEGASAVIARSEGGNGGKGGEGNAGGGDGHGRNGGNGGAGGDVTLTLGPADIAVLNDAGAVFIQSFGGGGGEGGKGTTGAGKASGGDGGTGGRSGNITVSKTTGAAQIQTISSQHTQHAIVIQSIAGDGGKGGDAQADSFGNADAGNGGQGGQGGDITADIWADIDTNGPKSQAVFARSYGGAGGDGGAANSTFNAGNGGAGAGSGPAGNVSVTFEGSIRTRGDEANGILVQSVGGFSGDGGSSSGFEAFGGSSESAGGGGLVDAHINGSTSISTDGARAYGIQAQSVGGGGGRGGSGLGLVSLGGSGSAGGDGNNVTVIIEDGSTVATKGDHAIGVHASSVGGGGGDGGGAVGIAAIGGAGGSGGAGATVKVDSDALITTEGVDATGIFAASVGGGGGSADTSVGALSIGGSGGDGGSGGVVSIDNSDLVTTKGDDADAVFGQSVGGGGGHGSNSVSVSAGFSLSIGGAGGSGGFSNSVTYTDSGNAGRTISTEGDRARGVFLQSVGGSGGDGGSAVSVGVTSPVSVSLGMSGQGGGGGHSGMVEYLNGLADIQTQGSHSSAIHVQSVGGGGGNAGTDITGSAGAAIDINVAIGSAGGDGGDGAYAAVESKGAMTTAGDNSSAIVVQSIGGGGGNAGTTVAGATVSGASLSTAIGGSGGSGGDAAAVYADGAGGVTTAGHNSTGLMVQSIGGGGGNGSTTIAASGVSLASGNASVGGAGGSGGTSNTVTISWGDTIATAGDNAAGVVAQSIGGGGGHSGTTVAGAGSSMFSAQVGVGGSGGSGGHSDNVTVKTFGDITTMGDISSGVLAQSIGGGGGHSGTTIAGTAISNGSLNFTVGGSGGSGGDAMAVQADVAGISTAGHSSSAVTAMSIGGGGGSSHFTGSFSGESQTTFNGAVGGSGGTGGIAGKVTVSATGDLSTVGHNSAGVKALSVGGGGGDSGVTATGSLDSQAGLGASVGGGGGDGGTADTVDVTVAENTHITTKGTASEGIIASSIAGGGGTAGYVFSGSAIAAGSGGISVGGGGGNGGTSAKVTVSNGASITTEGDLSSAIEARSVAGGGGSSKGSITGSALSMADLSITIGGSGGDGGMAGDVSVANTSETIKTAGVHSAVIVAQSIGGSGGGGGYAAEGSLTGGEYSGQIGVSIGGAGGNGGTSGTVSVTSASSASTENIGSSVIVAQSIGGSGGAGGNVYTGNISLSSSASVSADVNVGGAGGDGAKGADVVVENTGSLHTGSYLSDVILAQSVGGNGGSGGSVFTVLASVNEGSSGQLDVNVGGAGGSGQDAGAVSVTNAKDSWITAGSGGSNGISAMSVGGGGGKGGNAANILLDPAPGAGDDEGTSVSASVNVGVGGSGGVAGDGNKVQVVNDGLIDVGGDSSKGIYALSVGGGGGTGGTASSTSISYDGVCNAVTGGTGYACAPSGGDDDDATTVSASLTSTVGGSGGAAGNGGEVDVTTGTGSSISTTGRVGHAVVAHSIGGGGGDGAEGSLGIEAWTSNQTADTIANLPGNFTFIPDFSDVSMSIGGSGGASGDGGAVSVSGAAVITTQGDHSFGIHAQSIGGGGGNGGAGSTGLWSEATVGGKGSGGGNGGTVTVKQTGRVETTGKGSVGIFAQSVGGGGGTAGDVEQAFTDDWLNLNIGAGVGVQQASGGGGDGGDITLETGEIVTWGEAAHGIIAQSVGGSGGIGSISGAVGANSPTIFAGGAGDGGNAGKIDITTNGAISVSGDNAHAIVAQSSTGRLGSGDQSGDISITVNDNITASGTGGRAILAQSDGDVRGTIAITVAQGATVSNADDGAETIGLFHGTDANSIVNDGTIRHEGSDADDYVIRTNGFGLTLQNNGLLEGSILSASNDPNGPVGGPIEITNATGGSIGLGGTVNLGGGGFLANSGTISAGTPGTVGATQLTGDLSQTSTGTIQVDYTAGGTSDLITVVSGGQPSLAGAVDPNPLGSALTSGSTGSITYLTSNPGIASNTLTVQDTSTVNYNLSQTGNDLILSYDVDYAPWNGSAEAQSKVSPEARSELTENHTRFAASVNDMFAAQAGGSSDFADDLSNFLLEVPTVSDLLDVYDRYAPTEIFAPTDTALYASLRFMEGLTNCPANVTDGAFGFADGGNCAWGRISGASITRDGDLAEYDENVFSLSLGGQTEFSPDWFASAAIGYDRTNLSSDNVSGSGDRFHFGAGVKRQLGQTSLSAAVLAGQSDITLDRSVITPDGTQTSTGEPNTYWLGGHVRVAHDIALSNNSYVRPWLDLGVQRIWQDAFTEGGAGDYSLTVGETNNTLFTVNPMLEYGTSFNNGAMSGEFVISAGALILMGDTDQSAWVNMVGAGGAGGYVVNSDMERYNASINTGLNLQIGKQSSLEATVGALLSEDQQQINGGLRLVFTF